MRKVNEEILRIKKLIGSDELIKESVDFGPPLKGKLSASHPYGEKRKYEIHPGVDFIASTGSDVYSIADGTVTLAVVSNENRKCGGTIDIDFGEGYKARYCHIKKLNVSTGDKVKKGQLIGQSGGAAGDPGRGNSTGAHLHLSLRKGGSPLDPMALIQGKELNPIDSIATKDYSLSDLISYIFGIDKNKLSSFADKGVFNLMSSFGLSESTILGQLDNRFEYKEGDLYFYPSGNKKLMSLTKGTVLRNPKDNSCSENGISVRFTVDNETFYLSYCGLDEVFAEPNTFVESGEIIGTVKNKVRISLFNESGRMTIEKPKEEKKQEIKPQIDTKTRLFVPSNIKSGPSDSSKIDTNLGKEEEESGFFSIFAIPISIFKTILKFLGLKGLKEEIETMKKIL